MSAEGSGWQEGVLGWLASAVVAAPPSAAAGLAAFSAVLKLPPPAQLSLAAGLSPDGGGSSGASSGGGSGGGARAEQPSLGVLDRTGRARWWWSEDAGTLEFEAQLEGLARGGACGAGAGAGGWLGVPPALPAHRALGVLCRLQHAELCSGLYG